MKKFRFFSVLATFVLCYLLWIMFTLNFKPQEIVLGAVVSLVVALFSSKFLIHEKPLYFFKPKRLYDLIHYCLIDFIKELWSANVHVAKEVLNTKLSINPGIIRVPSELRSEYGLAILGNSISLKPGTTTLEIVEENGKNYFYIHWINVTTTRSKEAGDIIKGTLEKRIRRFMK